MFASLEEKLQSLYTRPYLAQGSAERSLLMLNALLEVCTSTSVPHTVQNLGTCSPPA